MHHLPKNVRVGFPSQKLSSKHLNFLIKLPIISNDYKLSDKLHINVNLLDYYVGFFSQDIVYKLNLVKNLKNSNEYY